jgi:hypothetical protein
MSAAPRGFLTAQVMAAPRKANKADVQISMAMTREWVDAIDAFRREEPGLPNRTEAVRILTNEALAARAAARAKAPKPKPE